MMIDYNDYNDNNKWYNNNDNDNNNNNNNNDNDNNNNNNNNNNNDNDDNNNINGVTSSFVCLAIFMNCLRVLSLFAVITGGLLETSASWLTTHLTASLQLSHVACFKPQFLTQIHAFWYETTFVMRPSPYFYHAKHSL